MRAVIQRVSRAEVRILDEGPGGEPTEGDHTRESSRVLRRSGFDGEGLVVLLGVTHDDGEAEAVLLAEKIWTQRILAGERSCEQAGAPLLVVSQFTLYGDVRKGRRPSWSAAAAGPVSAPLYTRFVEILRERGATVHTGEFGAAMEVDLINDGPVTLIIDTEDLRRPRRQS